MSKQHKFISQNTKPLNRKERRRRLQEEPVQVSQKPHRFQFAKRLFSSTLFWMITLMTIISFCYLIYPRISVRCGETLNPYDPFQTPFVLSNDGNLPLKDITYSLILEKVNLAPPDEKVKGPKLNFNDSTLKSGAFTIPSIGANKTSVISLKKAFKMPPNYVRSATIKIALSYKSSIIPHTFNDSIRFKVDTKTNGEYVWFEDYGKK
jgi:hypothetical protein